MSNRPKMAIGYTWSLLCLIATIVVFVIFAQTKNQAMENASTWATPHQYAMAGVIAVVVWAIGLWGIYHIEFLKKLFVDSEMHIVFPMPQDTISTEKATIRGSCLFRPKGEWMLWTRVNSEYWPQESLIFSADGKSWTASVIINTPEHTAILLTKIIPEIECLIDYYNLIGRKSGRWIGIPIPQSLGGFKVVDEVIVQRIMPLTSSITPSINSPRPDGVDYPEYPSPFAGEATQWMGNMGNNYKSFNNGIYELDELNRVMTQQSFTAPIAFRVVAKTNSTNLRMGYAETEIIFVWETALDDIHIWGGPLGKYDKKIYAQSAIPKDTWVVIDLIYTKTSMSVFINDSHKLTEQADFSGIKNSFSVFQGARSTVHVCSVQSGQPKSI
jgi:hypothetical protein